MCKNKKQKMAHYIIRDKIKINNKIKKKKTTLQDIFCTKFYVLLITYNVILALCRVSSN